MSFSMKNSGLDFSHLKKSKHSKIIGLLLTKKAIVGIATATGGVVGVTQTGILTSDTAITEDVTQIQVDPETGYQIFDDNIVEEQFEELISESNEYVGGMITYMNDAYYFDLDVQSDYGWGSFSASIDLTATGLGGNGNFDNCRVGPGVGKTGCTVGNTDMSFNLTNIKHSNNIVIGQHVSKTENTVNIHNNNEIITGSDITQPVEDYYTSKSDFGIGMVIAPSSDSCKLTDTTSKNNSALRDFNCITGKLIYNSVKNLDANSLEFISVENKIATFEANTAALTNLTNFAYSSAGDLGTGSISKAIYKIDTKGTIETDDDVILSSYFEYTNNYQTNELISLNVNYSNWLVGTDWDENDRV